MLIYDDWIFSTNGSFSRFDKKKTIGVNLSLKHLIESYEMKNENLWS